jgi:hypothetical protein
MEDAKENDVTDAQGERRRLLEEWRAKKVFFFSNFFFSNSFPCRLQKLLQLITPFIAQQKESQCFNRRRKRYLTF